MSTLPVTSPLNTVIGERYLVPCVKVSGAAKMWLDGYHWVAVLRPLHHEDREHIGFPFPHWHTGYRFIARHNRRIKLGDVVFIKHVIEGPVSLEETEAGHRLNVEGSRISPFREVTDRPHLARLAADRLHGRERVRLEARQCVDEVAGMVEIGAGTDVGQTLAIVFAGYVRREFGDGPCVRSGRPLGRLPRSIK